MYVRTCRKIKREKGREKEGEREKVQGKPIKKKVDKTTSYRRTYI